MTTTSGVMQRSVDTSATAPTWALISIYTQLVDGSAATVAIKEWGGPRGMYQSSKHPLQATMKGHFGGLIPPHMDSSLGWMNPPCVTSRSPGFIHRPWGGFIHAALAQPDFGFLGPVWGPFGASCWVFSQGSLLCPSYHVS
ncbi:hypothetical protein C8R43DRAFT_947833 [Mycena crocata]|nr:hypothetical protein C8R43DRAFT_947833 [Mycena crocata]